MKGPNGETIYLKCMACGAILYTQNGMRTHVVNVHMGGVQEIRRQAKIMLDIIEGKETDDNDPPPSN